MCIIYAPDLNCTYIFFLSFRTIVDVNIDAFDEKPWRHPGVDITDYFNFDFDEDSWKKYCNNLVKRYFF